MEYNIVCDVPGNDVVFTPDIDDYTQRRHTRFIINI